MRYVSAFVCWLGILVLSGVPAFAADKLTTSDVRDKPPEWYSTDEGKRAVDGIIAGQLESGGWRKGYNLLDPKAGSEQSRWAMGTYDNNMTYTELRVLGEAYRLTKRADALAAFNRGLDFVFASQYASGGFPQRWPVPDEEPYGGYITLNDHAMIRVMGLLLDVATQPEFAFVDADRRAKAQAAFDRGVDCLVKLQIEANGRLTGWCQQYDAQTLEPAKARTYELPSIAGDETVGVLRLLMRIEDPSPEVRRAIEAGVAWLEASKVTGIRLERTEDPSLPKGYDLKAVEDPNAEVLWARFYEIDTNRPFFCGRDGVKKYSMNEIEAERRSGYAWLRPFAKDIPKEYAKWKARVGERG